MIFVTVGSKDYPFDRLFKKLDELYEDGTLTEEMFAQTGVCSYQPKHYGHQDFLSGEDLEDKISRADIVVCHGGSGSIMSALRAGKKVIVVTRLEKYGEHVNDHQLPFNEALSRTGHVLMAEPELTDLGACFSKIYHGTDGLKKWENRDPMSVVRMVDQFIQENWSGRG